MTKENPPKREQIKLCGIWWWFFPLLHGVLGFYKTKML